MMLLALEALSSREVRNLREARHAGRDHELLRLQRHLFAVTLDDDGPLALALVEGSALARGRGPVIELHDPGVGFEPVAHLVLGRVDRPVIGKRQVRQVVVPDRIVQAERLVAIAPCVARPSIAVDDQGGHTEPLQARAERDTALPAADHQHVGLAVVAQFPCIGVAAVGPGHSVLEGAVLRAVLARRPLLLLEALQFQQRREEGPGLAVLQPDMTRAAALRGLEGEPARSSREREGVGLHLGKPGPEHVRHRRAALQRHDIPGEGDEVAPVAVVGKQRRRRIDVRSLQGGRKLGKPLGLVHCHPIATDVRAAHSRRRTTPEEWVPESDER